MGKVILTYWPLRGLGNHIKLICEQGGVDYEYRPMNGELWATEKPTIDLDYPNLPHIADGDLRISESGAICKYLAKKGGLMPTTDQEIINSDMAEGVCNDLTWLFVKLVFNPNFAEDRAKYPEQAKAKFALFEKVLGKRQFLAGDRVTWIDLSFYERLDVNTLMVPDILDDYPNLKEYKSRIEALEGVAAYLASDRFSAFPVSGGPAAWGKEEGKSIFD